MAGSQQIPAGFLKESSARSSGEGTSVSEDGRDQQTIRQSALSNASQDNTVLQKADSRPPQQQDLAREDDPDALYRHLPAHQAEIIKRQIFIPELKTGVAALYRYSSTNDVIVLIIAALCAIASGAALPLMTILFGSLQSIFQDYFLGFTTYDEYEHELTKYVLYFVYLAIGEFISTYIATLGFSYAGEHITVKIRERYLESCMRQNIGFFDTIGAGEVTTRITADTNLIQDGISEKVSLSLAAVATFVTAFVIGFIKYWKLTLILSSALFALVFLMGSGSQYQLKNNQLSLQAYAVSGTLADEVFSSIRNAVAFGTQDRLALEYDKHLQKAEHFGFRNKAAISVMFAGIMFIMFSSYGLAFWQGSKFLIEGVIPLSTTLTVLMAVIIGAFNLGNIAPNLQAFTTAVAAAAKIFNTIDRESPIDPADESGDKLEEVIGNLRLEGVDHIYPSRPEVKVMKNVSLTIPAGTTTALVGASGSGKSTIVGLVERFYEPVEGTIYLDGHDISKLNLRWLRQQMALVSQEPTLFATTIYHNIRYGLIGSKFEDESEAEQRERIYEAARMANAHDFITSLPEAYETNVGERGFLLSGGQKQRIAIARAIVSDPKIIFLDEATSALDTKSEGIVQAALEVASKGRTTITIAHRLSTIRDADNIVVMSAGEIVEQGTHDQLLKKQGAYFNLVTAQDIAGVEEEMDPDEVIKIVDEEAKIIHRMSTIHGTDKEFELQVILTNPNEDTEAKMKRYSAALSFSNIPFPAEKPEDVDRRYSFWTLIKLIMSFNRPEWKIMVIGLLFCVICGGSNPTSAVFFSKQISTLSVFITDDNREQVKHDSDFWSSMYLMLAIVQFVALTGQGILFAIGSEKLVHRVRDRAFRTFLRQDIAFFDQEEHTAGALTSFLSTTTTHAAGLSGVTLGTLLVVSITLIAACSLGLAIGWKLSLVCISTLPVVLGCGFFRFWLLTHFQQRSKQAYDSSASYASEAISAIRTVAALTREEDVLRQYSQSLTEQRKRSFKAVAKTGLLYAASQSLLFLCFALGFWYGGTLIGRHEYTMFQFFLCFLAVIFGAQSAGTIFSFAPDMGKAYSAACELKTLFDRQPSIDTWSEEGQPVHVVDGTIEFRDVHFRYPLRPEQPVLQGLNLVVHPGQYVALVGASGCGKSTTIALLERFYDPSSGGIFIDGDEINTLNINHYRSFIALVSQEPTLYQGTIKDNILLGASGHVSDAAVEHACREANIYDFIISLPEGFSTIVGSKGTLLSGGQKQRIAIARALIRDPKILLLDEATSALDSESEHVVQAALDKAARGRTTIAVAHRLSTIQNADVICVFDQGRIVESGTHSELMKVNGRYAELVNLQSLGEH